MKCPFCTEIEDIFLHIFRGVGHINRGTIFTIFEAQFGTNIEDPIWNINQESMDVFNAVEISCTFVVLAVLFTERNKNTLSPNRFSPCGFFLSMLPKIIVSKKFHGVHLFH